MHYLNAHPEILGSFTIFMLLATAEGLRLLLPAKRTKQIGRHIAGRDSPLRPAGRPMQGHDQPRDEKRRLRPMRPASPRGARRYRMPSVSREVFQGRGAKRVLPTGELLRSWRE